MQEQNSDPHFNKTFWFICALCAVILTYVFCITYVAIPKDNQRFADTCVAYLLGVVSAAIAWLVGGSPVFNRKPPNSPGTTTSADISVTTTTEPENTTEKKL